MEQDSTPFDLHALLNSIAQASDPAEDLVPNDIKKLIIVIKGNQTDGSFDYQVALAIADLQQVIYRLVAHSIYGEDATAKILSEQELEQFKLSFTVAPGSTVIDTEILESIIKILESVFKDMSPIHILILATLLSCLFLGIIGVKEAFKYMTFKKDKAADVAKSQAETERLKVILAMVSRAGEEASTNFAKSMKGATDLKFGDREFSAEELSKLQKRKPRSPIVKEMVDGAYVVKAIDHQQATSLTVLLEEPIKKEVFKAIYNLGGDDDESAGTDKDTDTDTDDDEIIEKMLTSLRDQTSIKLSIAKRNRVEDSRTIKASIMGLADE